MRIVLYGAIQYEESLPSVPHLYSHYCAESSPVKSSRLIETRT